MHAISSGRVRVLVVEDEAVIQLAIEDLLLRAGLDPVALAQDYESALRAVDEVEFDLVLMDVNLGQGPDGIETAAAVLERVDVPIIFLTAYANAGVVSRAMEVAPYGYLLKPFDEGLLQITIRLALQRHGADVKLRTLAAAVEQAPVGVLMVNARSVERVVEFANGEFGRMAGVDPADVVGNVPCFLASDPDAPAVQRLRLALEHGHEAREVIVMQGAQGERFSAVQVTPVQSPQGTTEHLVVVHSDLTALRQAQDLAASRERSELVGRLAAGAAHDFNNVLSLVLSHAELGLDHEDLPEEVRTDLLAISKAVERGAELTARLPELSRAGGGSPQAASTDCVSALRQSAPSLRQAIGPAGRLRFELPPGPLFVPVDLKTFQRIVLHLAAYACDATPGGGDVEISTQVFPERLSLRLHRCADASWTGAATHENSEQTALWAARVLAERDGGDLAIAEEADGGTSLTLTLPLVAAPEEEPPTPADSWSDVRAEGICLVVDHNPELASAYTRALTRVGLEVKVAHSLAAARQHIDRLGGSLGYLVTALKLDGESGVSIVEHVQRVAPRAKTVIVSGYAAADVALPAEATILWKPFSLDTLVRAMFLSESSKEPDHPPVPAVAVPEPRLPQASTEARVLLLDGDDETRGGMASVLRAKNLEVVEATSAESALDSVQRESFDVLLVEVRPPDSAALAVVEAARRRDPEVPALFLAAESSPEITRLAIQHRVAGFLGTPVSPDELWGEVERALDSARVSRLQRNLMRISPEAMPFLDDVPESKRLLEESLAELYVVYQPIVRAYDSGVHAYEALVRSRGPLGNPALLIAAAEALGRMDDLGRAIRARIAKDLDEAPERREDIFVNLHPTEFDSRLLSSDEPLLPHASRVVFEVTERAQLRSEDETRGTLDAIRAFGFRIALDDLGEGYAGLTWISKLGPDVIKLDMTLVRDVDVSAIKRDIITAVVGLCRRSQTLVVAEGVETDDEAATVRALGCDLLQGYLFARPGLPFPRP